MHTFLDSKIMAKALRTALAERQIDISHSDSLELVARQYGFDNWNILAARIEATTRKLALPAAWIVGGGDPDLYRIGIDPSEPGVVRLERIPGTGTDQGRFATLMQSIDAADYVGRALRLTAQLRSESAGRGALWMRVDPASGGRWMRFDNMHQRTKEGPLEGDTGWVERSVALDIPEGAGSIHYGIMLNGGGNLWARNVTMQEAEPTGATAGNGTLPRRPTNLGFGEAA